MPCRHVNKINFANFAIIVTLKSIDAMPCRHVNKINFANFAIIVTLKSIDAMSIYRYVDKINFANFAIIVMLKLIQNYSSSQSTLCQFTDMWTKLICKLFNIVTIKLSKIIHQVNRRYVNLQICGQN